jgi:hypothetical protein
MVSTKTFGETSFPAARDSSSSQKVGKPSSTSVRLSRRKDLLTLSASSHASRIASLHCEYDTCQIDTYIKFVSLKAQCIYIAPSVKSRSRIQGHCAFEIMQLPPFPEPSQDLKHDHITPAMSELEYMYTEYYASSRWSDDGQASVRVCMVSRRCKSSGSGSNSLR